MLPGDECPTKLNDTPGQGDPEERHLHPSVAMNWAESVQGTGSTFHVAFLISPLQGDPSPTKENVRWWIHDFAAADFVSPSITNPEADVEDTFPSAGIGGLDECRTWGNIANSPVGLALEIDGSSFAASIEPCTVALCPNGWTPAVWMRENGDLAIAYADAEFPGVLNSPTNIRLRVYESDGTLIGGPLGTDILVNNPSIEDPPGETRDQLSPAVAMDDEGHILTTWFAFRPHGCTVEPVVYARRFFFDGTTVNEASKQFIVNSTDTSDYAISNPRPTVAIRNSEDPHKQGEFLIAWNAGDQNNFGLGVVHGQYFDKTGRPMGNEFQVHVQTSPNFLPVPENAFECHLGASAQHTADYGPDGQVLVAWTWKRAVADENNSFEDTVHFTILPANYAETLEAIDPDPCCKGDVNGDGLRDGLDIQPFVDLLLAPDSQVCLNVQELCPPDLNSDGVIDVLDIPPFVSTILAGEPCDQTLQPRGLEDCNENGIPDANDIADCDDDPACEDCNGNFIPDGCDIEAETSADVNENGVPDECEPDCNGNDVPDDADINGYSTGGTPVPPSSEDVNENGIPDECEADCNGNGVPDDLDISQETSADCNENGWPDECEWDCNANGVPDDCDVNGYSTGETPVPPVSQDCNGNGLPDECDLELPILPSLDCNENGVPDECDINGYFTGETPVPPVSEDCNENGFPDECDIASEISEDENENGIPDECEQQQAQGGGGGGPAPSAISAEPSQAWEEFWHWSAEQTWGPGAEISPAAQFQRYVDKLRELGLPLGHPWAAPASSAEE